LALTREEIRRIAQETLGQYKNPTWHVREILSHVYKVELFEKKGNINLNLQLKL